MTIWVASDLGGATGVGVRATGVEAGGPAVKDKGCAEVAVPPAAIPALGGTNENVGAVGCGVLLAAVNVKGLTDAF